MRTVAIIASKGGAGKSTIAAATAVAAAAAGEQVAVLDFDPQCSLDAWWHRRLAETGEGDNPHLFRDVRPERLKSAIEKIAARDFTLLVIDGPPAFLETQSAIAAVADLIVVPVMASPQDVEAIEPVVKVAQRHRRPLAFLVNRVPAKSNPLVEGVVSALEPDGPVLATRIQDRAAHPAAMATGKTAAEIDRASRKEAAALWGEIKALLDKPHAPSAKRASTIE